MSLRLTSNGTPGPDAARRFLQPEQPASTTTRPSDPRRVRSKKRVQLALNWEVTLRKGLGPLPLRRPPTPGDALTSTPSRAFRLGRDASVGRQSRFHRSGAGRLSPPGTSHTLVWQRVTELCPDPIRSDTSCHETVAVPGGEPVTGCRTAKAEQHNPAVSPRKPFLARKRIREECGLRGLCTACFREAGNLRGSDVRFRESHIPAWSGDTGPLA